MAPTAEPVIVVAGVDVDGANITVSGYVAGILESGGECEYAFAGASGEFAATSIGEADRSSTACGAVQVPITQFSKGTWEVTLSYEALGGAASRSHPVPLEIP